VLAGSRRPDKLGELAGWGVSVRKADFDDPATLAGAFAGIDRILIISTDAIFVPGQRIQQHLAAIDAAVRSGVRHIVYTSMPNPEPPSVMPIAPDHYATEQRIAQSGIGFTILRNSWYTENLLRSLPGVFASGKWFTSAGQGRMNYIARNDIARAAAAALSAGEEITAARYDLTGPKSMTVSEIAAVASAAFDRPIEVIQVSDDELARTLAESGMPAAWIPRRVATDMNMRAGKFDIESDAVRRLTGTPPQSLRDFLLANRSVLDST
jgi:NAD(P)H dehydrogenase (quinone)